MHTDKRTEQTAGGAHGEQVASSEGHEPTGAMRELGAAVVNGYAEGLARASEPASLEDRLRERLEGAAAHVFANEIDPVAAAERDAVAARVRERAVRNGHTLDRGPVVERECHACSALVCLVPEAIERFAKGLEGAPTPPELERLAAPMLVAAMPFPPVPPDARDELLHRALAAIEVMLLEPERAPLILEEIHDEIAVYMNTGKRPDVLHIAPTKKLITSTRAEYHGTHAAITVWNRGGNCGRLIVDAKDARLIAARLEGNAWREEASTVSGELAHYAEEVERLEEVLHDELEELKKEGVELSVLNGVREELEGLAATMARRSREVRA